jgi:hypothetical protein
MLVENLGDRRGVGGQAHDGFAALARGDIGRGQAPDGFLALSGQV